MTVNFTNSYMKFGRNWVIQIECDYVHNSKPTGSGRFLAAIFIIVHWTKPKSFHPLVMSNREMSSVTY